MNGAVGDGGHLGGQARPPDWSEIDAALSDLNQCVDRIHALIPRVTALIERRHLSAPRRRTEPRIIYGGGPSAFARRRSSWGDDPRRRDASIDDQVSVDPAAPDSSGQLLLAADLALAGYSRDQIGARLRASHDPDAPRAIDDAFE